MNIQNVFVLTAWLLFVFYGVKIYTGGGVYNDHYLERENTISLRGICAVSVLFHHAVGNCSNVGLLEPFRHIGYLVVGVFFFLSGFGVCWGYRYKKDYLSGFLKKRLVSLLIPYWFVNVLYVIIFNALGTHISPIRFLESLIGINLINRPAWYIFELILLYIIFYISFQRRKKSTQWIAFLLLICITIGIFCFMNIDKLWIRSIFAFPLGVAWCCYKEKIDAYLKTKCGVLVFICSSIVLLFSAVLSVYGEYRGIDIILTIGEIVGSSAFCIWLFTLLFKVNFNNKATRFFGKYAMEVYLLHNLFLTVMNRVEFVAKNNALYILCTVIFTAIGAVLLKKINDIVINRLYFKNSVN